MIKDARSYSIRALFSENDNATFYVPKYQREYAWGAKQCEALFDDIFENESGYFIGSIICISQVGDALNPKLEVIDGQQRMMTMSILFSALYACLKDHREDFDDDMQFTLTNIKRSLVSRTSKNLKFVPQIQSNNLNDYKMLLESIGLMSHQVVAPYAGNRKIFKAFKIFKDQIQQLVDSEGLDKTFGFVDKLLNTYIVKIEVGSHSAAYTLFESLNNRGIPLTAIDLIKNKLLSKIDDGGDAVDASYDEWKNILQYLGEDYSVQERFFRQYYNAYKSKLNPIAKVPIATKSNLIDIYEKIIDHDSDSFLNNITKAAEVYAKILLNNEEGLSSGLKQQLKDLSRIQGVPSYLLVLYLMMNKDYLGIEGDTLVTIMRLLVNFFVRRSITDIPPTRDLTRMFMDCISDIEASIAPHSDFVHLIKQRLVSNSSPDDFFREKLQGPIYDNNRGATRFILCSLEESEMTIDSQKDLWRRGAKNKYALTIEHIFPQGKNIPNTWVEMIAQGDTSLAVEYRENYVHTLGNLTITGYNGTLGNLSFIDKRDRTDKSGKQVGYRNELNLNTDLCQETSWTIEKIEQRTEKLVDKVMELFSFEKD